MWATAKAASTEVSPASANVDRCVLNLSNMSTFAPSIARQEFADAEEEDTLRCQLELTARSELSCTKYDKDLRGLTRNRCSCARQELPSTVSRAASQRPRQRSRSLAVFDNLSPLLKARTASLSGSRCGCQQIH